MTSSTEPQNVGCGLAAVVMSIIVMALFIWAIWELKN